MSLDPVAGRDEMAGVGKNRGTLSQKLTLINVHGSHNPAKRRHQESDKYHGKPHHTLC